MKLLRKILIALVIVLLIMSIFIFFLFNSLNRSIRHGEKENAVQADYSELNATEPINITYLGDSLTVGYQSDSQVHTDKKGYDDYINEQLANEELLGETYNFAVGGDVVADTQAYIDNDVTLNHTHELQSDLNCFADSEIEAQYAYDESKEITISEAIENSDIVIITIGSNNILEVFSGASSLEKIAVDDSSRLKDFFLGIESQKEFLYRSIKEINPDVEIYDVGSYVPYSSIDLDKLKKIYPLLIYFDSLLRIDNKEQEIYSVEIHDNLISNLTGYLDNPEDVHPNEEGYKVIANEISKEIIENYDEEEENAEESEEVEESTE